MKIRKTSLDDIGSFEVEIVVRKKELLKWVYQCQISQNILLDNLISPKAWFQAQSSQQVIKLKKCANIIHRSIGNFMGINFWIWVISQNLFLMI